MLMIVSLTMIMTNDCIVDDLNDLMDKDVY